MPISLPIQKFAELCREGKSFAEAQRIAGVEFKSCSELSGFYVYLLVDPRDDSVFYVGKGTGKRFSKHERDAINGRIGNPFKHERIWAILAAGKRVGTYAVESNMHESNAYDLETALIRLIGLDRLTNWKQGEPSESAKMKALARHRLQFIKPFDEWMRETPRTIDDINSYHRIVAEYQHIAANGWVSAIMIPNDGMALCQFLKIPGMRYLPRELRSA